MVPPPSRCDLLIYLSILVNFFLIVLNIDVFNEQS